MSKEKLAPIWERDTLTKTETKLAEIFLVVSMLYLAVGMPIYIGRSVEDIFEHPGLFIALWKKIETFHHLSSVVATLGIFAGFEIALEDYLLIKKGKINRKKIEMFRRKWLPIFSAVAIGFFHWFAESKYGTRGMGTKSLMDAVYGILYIFPAHIILQYCFRKNNI